MAASVGLYRDALGRLYSAYPLGNAPTFPYTDQGDLGNGRFVHPVTGSDTTGDGSAGNPWQTIAHGGAQLTAGQTLYLRQGTHNVTAPISMLGWNSGTSGNEITVAMYPGETGTINFSGNVGFTDPRFLSYWRFRNLRVENYQSAWDIGLNGSCDNFHWEYIDGYTDVGGDNRGMIFWSGDGPITNNSADRCRATWTGGVFGGLEGNTGGVYIGQEAVSTTWSIVIDHFETHGFSKGLFFKIGPNRNITAHEGNTIIRNSFFNDSQNWDFGSNQYASLFEHNIFRGRVYSCENNGFAGGMWNRYIHCTFLDETEGLQLYDNSGDPMDGGLRTDGTTVESSRETYLRNCLIGYLRVSALSSVRTGSDYNCFIQNIDDAGTSRDIASWRSANGTDANSVQGTPTFAGSDFGVISSYEITGGAGYQTSEGGANAGADISRVGIYGT